MTVNKLQGLINLIRLFAIIILIYIGFSLIIFIWGIVEDLQISPELWSQKTRPQNQKVIAIITPLRPGERQQAYMVADSAKKMGHLTYVFAINDQDMRLYLPNRYLNELLLYYLAKRFKPDIHLSMSFHVNIEVPDPKIMYISIPPEYYKNKVDKFFPLIKQYNNFIDINLIYSQADWLSPFIGRKINRIYGIVGAPENSYNRANYGKLLLFGSLWGRKTDNLYGAIKMLSKKDYMYFIKHIFLVLDDEDKQKFVEPARSFKDLQLRLNQYGVGLCAHSHYHNEVGIPSSRIFEIISAGAVAISDKNPFIYRFFGDNILYYDQTASAEEIFKRIDDHMRWIHDNPLDAEEKSRNAHNILHNYFSTEIFIKNIFSSF